MKNLVRMLLGGTCLMLLSSCATPSFNRMWKSGTGARDPRGIAGAWEGTWVSRKNDHKGALRCLVIPTGEDEYLFRYWAEWGPGFKGSFKIACQVEPSGSGYRVEGTKKLPMFGTYHHEGQISPTEFQATFRSDRKNLGEFTLSRPKD